MLHEFSRTELLIGSEALEKLKQSTVTIFGIGGVGGFALEGMVRAGVGNFILVDDDSVCLTNINRQIIATRKTVGKPKVEVAKQRMLEINPKVNIQNYQTFYLPGNKEDLLDLNSDYIVDAIDTVSAKIDLVIEANKRNIPIISCMGMGNKLDPTKIEVTDIYKTSICPLSRVMRKELRIRGVDSLKVVYSKEEPITPLEIDSTCSTHCICTNKERTCSTRRQIPGSISFVPSVAGLIIAGEVVKSLITL